MTHKGLIIFLLVTVFLPFVGCKSVENYNKKIAQPIEVEKLQQDIAYTKKQLSKYYPNLYGYISKEKLDYKFDSIQNAINKPLSSKEFYFLISPVIASVRQGHMTMTPALPKMSKTLKKQIKKGSESPVAQFNYEWYDNKLFITKNRSKDKSIKAGTEVVSIENITPPTLYETYKKTFTSDGYNTTFLPKFFARRLPTFITHQIGIQHSINITLKFKDSVYTKVLTRLKSKTTVKSDTTSKIVKKVEAIQQKPSKNIIKNKRIYGYDIKTNEYSKSLQFIGNDSCVAVLKIKNFSQGKYYLAYEKLFDSIKNKKPHTLILDLRDNPGGRISDAVTLYSYLTDKPFTLIQPAVVTSKISLWKSGLIKTAPSYTYPILIPLYPIYMGFTYIKTKKHKDGTYTYHIFGSKKQDPEKNYFTGKMYVLINGGSFSASCIVASNLKSNPNITFVGQETGGAFNGAVAGFMPVVTLPHSKIKLRLGLMDIKTKNQTNIEGRGIFPDKEIIPSIEEKTSNIDKEINWILKDIQNN